MRTITLLAFALALAGGTASAQDKGKVDPARIDAMVKSAFPTAPADWQPRLAPDESMQICSTHDNSPPPALAAQIKARELAKIEYPPDGKLIGDWKLGERLAQSGYGLRFTDYPARNPNGGNCYACHQLTQAEVSYGTMGPSLYHYGKLRDYGPAETKAAYEKIYDAHAAFPCSNMPRFGANKVLTIEQIRHLVALLMSPESPVNK
jgi:sulfur-oxidizing protein SoxX